MGLLGTGENNTGLIFLIIVVVLAFTIIYVARGGEFPSAPKFDFNTSEAASMFQYKDSGGNDMNSLFPYFSNNKSSASSVEAYFCPQDACADKLINKINLANKSVYIAIYSFTNDDIASAVIKAKQRGVDVKVIFDYDQSKNDASDDESLAQVGISVALKNSAGYMHNKYSIIDGNLVATGSFNYSENANTRNEENLVFIESPDLAQKFTQDFDGIWASSDKVN